MIEILLDSLQQIWFSFIGFLPTLLAALIVFIVGWIIAIALGKLANRFIKIIKLDILLTRAGFNKALEKAKVRLNSGKFFEELVKWFFIIVFLMAAVDILGLYQVTEFLREKILYFIPNIVVAAIILVVAVIVASFLQKLVKASVEAAGLKASGFISGITKWAILIVGFKTAIEQLGISATLINTILYGLVAMLALAGGLAFGLGGKDAATRFLEKLRKDIEEK